MGREVVDTLTVSQFFFISPQGSSRLALTDIDIGRKVVDSFTVL